MAVRKVVGAVLAKGEHALNRRGEIYTTVTIQEWLALRNFLDELRGTGVQKMHVGEVDRQCG